MWFTIAFAASVAVSLTGAVVSTWEILFRNFRPNLVSRFIWTAATAIGFATAVAGGAGWAAVPLAGMTAGSAIVTMAALVKSSVWDVSRVDLVCGGFAAVGLVAWRLTGDPALATVAAVIADGLAAIPTLRHTRAAPFEESWLSYSFGGAAAAIGLVALEDWSVATAGFSVYLVALCSTLVAMIVFGRRNATRGELL